MKRHSHIDNLHLDSEPVSAGDDGELLSSIFCTECGSVNSRSAVTCAKCGSLLAEQGTDLRARLARIKRHAQNDAAQPSSEMPEWLAMPRRLVTPQKRDEPLDPDQQRRLERIAEYARHGEQNSTASSLNTLGVLLIIVCYCVVMPLHEILFGKPDPAPPPTPRE